MFKFLKSFYYYYHGYERIECFQCKKIFYFPPGHGFNKEYYCSVNCVINYFANNNNQNNITSSSKSFP